MEGETKAQPGVDGGAATTADCPARNACTGAPAPPCADGCGVLGSGTASVPGTLHRRLCMEQALERAVAAPGRAFHLAFQPKVAADGGTAGFEVLLRWTDPVLHGISPAEFIPLAEERGLIGRLGHWVLEEACRQLAEWRAAGLTPVPLAVNVSPLQFSEEGFAVRVGETLAATGIEAGMLELEVTEGVLVDDAATLATLERLRALGVAVAVDDFGTGYSSLAYLKRLPLHRLKLDRSFVADLEDDARSRAVAAAVIELGHGLGLEVTAEGVETAGQRRWLRANGCDDLQGFGIARPMPAGDAGRWLSRY